ncbi:hypothetical protein [Flavobacterium pectinovorum]|uniref:Uncharacterized protein n=1 Tax=Flavobacterium pectinovorum TaxID=29533 RepID=A0A502E3B1_9FLAO|nr:hypothetical protein [Flavobacterium pectinovorum]TPG31814.1 hypothetical protein EAH81_26315 [Flavobacterium pectinovorum]
MQQFNFKNNILNLKVNKSPLVIRIVMFFFTFAFFVFPTFGVIVSILSGNGLQFGYFIAIGLFALMGFYLLRVSLWNTYGEENIEILKSKVIYEANYGWFKDGKKEIEIAVPKYSFKAVGYKEDNEGVLVISDGVSELESVVKIPVSVLEKLLWILEPGKNETV